MTACLCPKEECLPCEDCHGCYCSNARFKSEVKDLKARLKYIAVSMELSGWDIESNILAAFDLTNKTWQEP